MNNIKRICHKIAVSDEKDRQPWVNRSQKPIENTPKLLLGTSINNSQEIFIEKLSKISIAKLQLLNSNEKAYSHARSIIYACMNLSKNYGYFMINENMIFSNQRQEIVAWINPDILENKVKIYLPKTAEGLKTMIKSIINFLRLWIKFDHTFISIAKTFEELLQKIYFLEEMSKDSMNIKQLQTKIEVNRRGSTNTPIKQQIKTVQKVPPHLLHFLINPRPQPNQTKQNLITFNSSVTASLTTDYANHLKTNYINKYKDSDYDKNKTTLVSENHHQEDQIYFEKQVETEAQHYSMKKSTKIKGSNYFPNRTTATKRYGILEMIRQFDIMPNEEIKNNIVIEEDRHRQIQMIRVMKMKESRLNRPKIDQQLQGLFFSRIMNGQNDELNADDACQELQNVLNN